ncbi:MAG: dephospho-CoA kinase [bacterium]|nr:dephospho-CoA kinase [bacterium]
MRIALTGGIACGKSTLAKFLRELGIRLLDADDVVHELEAPGGAAVPAIVARFGAGVLAADGSVDRPKLAGIVFADAAARRDLEAILFPLVRSRLRAFTSAAARRGRRALPTPDACHDGVPTVDTASRGNHVPTVDVESFGNHVPTVDVESFGNHVPLVGADVLGRPPSTAPAPPSTAPVSRPPSTVPLYIAIIPLLFESHWEGDYDIILAITSPLECQIHRMMRTRGYSRVQAEARLAAQMPVAEKAARADFVVVNDSTHEHLKDEARRLVAWLKERAKYEQ